MAQGPRCVARRAQGARPLPIEVSPMMKYDKKVYCFSVSFSFFRLQRELTTILTTIQWPRAPVNSIYANQFKCITAEKLRVFVLKVAISGPHQTFL